MSKEEIIKEIYQPLMAKIMSVEKKVDAYYSMQNSDRKTETSENDAAIVELAEIISEMEGTING
jgi:hypothetical protein